MPSEISGLEQLHAFLKYGNRVTRFSFPYIDLPKAHPGFIERKMDDSCLRLGLLPTAHRSRNKLVPGEITEQQAALQFGNGQV